jgi:hypothetical protein
MTSRKADLAIKSRLQIDFHGSEQPHEALLNLREDTEAVNAYIKRFELPGRLTADGSTLVTFRPMGAGMVKLVRDYLRKAWTGEEEALQWAQERLDAERFSVSFKKANLVVEPRSLMGTVCLLVLRDHAAGKTAICANSDCHSPYFIRKRKTQKYCEAGPCTEKAQRDQKREWWTRHRGKGSK